MSAIRIFNTQSDELNDIPAFRDLIERTNLKDCKLVVISVAGKFRKGKSFLLNLFIRYLEDLEQNAGEVDWTKLDEPLQGFECSNLSERQTEGVLLWDRIFKINSSKGVLAVLLMDTQGVFDRKSSMEESSKLFAFSALTSSVQIYNVSGNLGGDDLNHLQFFSEYAQLARTAEIQKMNITNESVESEGRHAARSNKAPFQDLIIMVRDWYYADHECGWDGGKEFFKKILEDDAESNSEIRNSLCSITTCFSNRSCFLAEHPGKGIKKKPNDIRLKDLESGFVNQMKEFLSRILDPEQLALSVKRINGCDLTLKEFPNYICSYIGALKDPRLPQAEAIFSATKRAANKSAKQKTIDAYNSDMDQLQKADPHAFVDWQLIEKTHKTALERAKDIFDDYLKIGHEDELLELYEDTFHIINLYYEKRRNTNKIAQLLKEMKIQQEKTEKEHENLKKQVNDLESEIKYLNRPWWKKMFGF